LLQQRLVLFRAVLAAVENGVYFVQRFLRFSTDTSKLTRTAALGEPFALLDGVLPLFNAILPTVVSYNPMAGVMTLRRQPGLVTFYPDRVMITQVADVDEGLAMLAAVRDLVNQTWTQREQIQPRQEGRRTPRPLDVYELLPRSNCRTRYGSPLATRSVHRLASRAT
jgi:ArsR family metal-binding transcriptional regulator